MNVHRTCTLCEVATEPEFNKVDWNDVTKYPTYSYDRTKYRFMDMYGGMYTICARVLKTLRVKLYVQIDVYHSPNTLGITDTVV